MGRQIDDSGAETEATNSITFKPWHRTVAVPGLFAFPDDHGREPQRGSERFERRPATYIGSETLLLPSYHRHLRNIGKKRITVVSVDHSTEVDISRQTPSFSCFASIAGILWEQEIAGSTSVIPTSPYTQIPPVVAKAIMGGI